MALNQEEKNVDDLRKELLKRIMGDSDTKNPKITVTAELITVMGRQGVQINIKNEGIDQYQAIGVLTEAIARLREKQEAIVLETY